MEVSDKLLYERVYVIKWNTLNTHGSMIVNAKYYDKNIKKFQRRFKDCNIYYMAEMALTPEKIEEVEKELSKL